MQPPEPMSGLLPAVADEMEGGTVTPTTTGLVAIVAVAASFVVGCSGGSSSSATKTVTKTVTAGGGAAAAGVAGGSEDFCASADGDAVTQADSEAEAAFNDAKVDAMRAATDKALKAAAKAPPGSQCAVDALNSIRQLWNQGSGGNLAGADVQAEVTRIRDFQAKHQLR